MTNLSNTDLQLKFHNYHSIIKNEFFRASGEKVLIVKSGDKELQILIEIFPLEQQELMYNGVTWVMCKP